VFIRIKKRDENKVGLENSLIQREDVGKEREMRRMNNKRTNERAKKKKKSYVFWFRIKIITEVPS